MPASIAAEFTDRSALSWPPELGRPLPFDVHPGQHAASTEEQAGQDRRVAHFGLDVAGAGRVLDIAEVATLVLG